MYSRRPLRALGDVVAGRYRIVSVLGRGGSAVTYAAEGPAGPVALKELVLAGSDGWKPFELFERQAGVR